MSHYIYLKVTEALTLHDLDCKCYICTAFVNAENGSKGYAAACLAVADRQPLNPSQAKF